MKNDWYGSLAHRGAENTSIVDNFAETEVALVPHKFDQKEELLWQNFKRMGEFGLTGMTPPVDYGGSDAGESSVTIATEGIGRACASSVHRCIAKVAA